MTTTSLPTIVNELGAALTKSAKYRKNHERNRVHRERIKVSRNDLPHLKIACDINASGSSSEPTTGAAQRKGKHKVPHVGGVKTPKAPPRAWFLDVASPTWEDMKAIGRLLHIHPLTLEDILQREPREKLDLFPKLGYYFISFRAIEGQEVLRNGDVWGNQPEAGTVGEANIYIVVFEEGVCTFHFTDMSEHTDRIQNRIQKLEETHSTSSDWIAHGILDSVVDSFFPFLRHIEKEVMAIEDLVFSTEPGENCVSLLPPSIATVHKQTPASDYAAQWHRSEKTTLAEGDKEDEKVTRSQAHDTIKFRTQSFSIPPLRILYHRARRLVAKILRSVEQPSVLVPSPTTITLRRMAKTRRLVVSLARLLAAKSEVIAQIRKRLLNGDQSGMGAGKREESMEIAIYMGDIQDHILTLQHSLLHYERMLSQSHPAYLSQLRTRSAAARSGTDKALLYLTAVSIAVLCLQTLLGSFSLNVHVPSNCHDPDCPYNVFGIVIALAVMVLCTYISIVRHWWFQARKRRPRPI
ncbi:hypothetical protein AX16_009603 [Volvariella volvacea WC 439]|nr:hypothetical protein AX16_009603 [Volvariella volvacea WC 439]